MPKVKARLWQIDLIKNGIGTMPLQYLPIRGAMLSFIDTYKKTERSDTTILGT